jgi:hypothetical protein
MAEATSLTDVKSAFILLGICVTYIDNNTREGKKQSVLQEKIANI